MAKADTSIEELEKFTDSVFEEEEKKLLKQFDSDKKYATALIVGRFQPLHRGHIYLIELAAKIAESVVIVIGSPNISNADNPLAVEVRKQLLERALQREHLSQKVSKIALIDDIPSDQEWLHETLIKTGPIDIVIGNNDWVNDIFQEAGYKTLPIPYLRREIYEGKAIRKKLREEGKL